MSAFNGQAFNPFTEQIAGEYFVGREEQIEFFQRALAGLREGQPRHLYVAGLHGTGKTSYLAKLVEISQQAGFIAVMATIDAAAPTKQHVSTIVKAVLSVVDQRQLNQQGSSAGALRKDWDSAGDSTFFRLPRAQLLESDDLRHDFEFLLREAQNAGAAGIVVCIDEGQRADPFALSALKNSLQGLSGYLIILSLRIVQDAPSATEQGRQMLNEKAKEAEGDYGASRFYVAGVPLGPFSSEDESRQCIVKRLNGNVVRFDDHVIREVGKVTARLPSAIVALASNIYDVAAETGQTIADSKILDASFRRLHHHHYAAAVDLVGSASEGERALLRSLLAIGRPVEAREIVAHTYPNLPKEAMAALVDGVAGELRRICQSSLCIRRDGKHEISNSYARYALELALYSP